MIVVEKLEIIRRDIRKDCNIRARTITLESVHDSKSFKT